MIHRVNRLITEINRLINVTISFMLILGLENPFWEPSFGILPFPGTLSPEILRTHGSMLAGDRLKPIDT